MSALPGEDKPENLLLAADDTLWVSDFGLARLRGVIADGAEHGGEGPLGPASSRLTQLGMGALSLRTLARQHLSGNSTETQLRSEVAKLTDIVNGLLAEREEKPARKKEKADG